MDYGQKQSADEPQAFFTAGVGNLPAEENTHEPENIDLTNDSTSWAPEHNLRNLGNKAILSPEEPNPSETIAPDGSGETIDITLPPDAVFNNQPETPSDIATFDPKLIVPDGDRISSSTLSKVEGVVSAFEQTGNAADFYTTIRGDDDKPGMVQSYLENFPNHRKAA